MRYPESHFLKGIDAGIQRFIEVFAKYTDSVVDQVVHRDPDYITTVDEFFAMRRHAVRAEPSYVASALGSDLYSDFFEDPYVVKLYKAAIDLVILWNENDDDALNIDPMIMHHHQFDLAGALN
ncbi:hypothetical protein DENSPDRAFT_934253 [Dentipellis sp. KUC8613]|nr:hypothetical protein DENSPDRAFT_934253 [Dentipellis sp. KUC8613]